MKNQSTTIGILSITALVLFIAQFIPVQPLRAEVALKDRDYSVLTAQSSKGGDNLFVADNRSGQMVALTWDAGKRSFIILGGAQLSDVFR